MLRFPQGFAEFFFGPVLPVFWFIVCDPAHLGQERIRQLRRRVRTCRGTSPKGFAVCVK